MGLKLLFIIIDRDKDEKAVAALNDAQLKYEHVILGHGTAKTNWSEILGLGETDKSIIVGTVLGEDVEKIKACLEKQFKFGEKGAGIAFTVPISSVGGPATYRILTGKSFEEKSENGQ